jgi:hypothetical protein
MNSRRVIVHIKYKGKMFAKAVSAIRRHPKREWMDVKALAKQVGTSTYTIYAARRWLKEQEVIDQPPFQLNSYRDEQLAITTEAAAITTNTQELVAEKGKVYGHPLDNFRDAQWGSAVIDKCKDDEVRFALGMIWLKICRLVETPDHKDTIDDIAGYAETIHMIHAERKKRGK